MLTGEKWLIVAYKIVPWPGSVGHLTSLHLDFFLSCHSARRACSSSALALSLAAPASSLHHIPNPVQAPPLASHSQPSGKCFGWSYVGCVEVTLQTWQCEPAVVALPRVEMPPLWGGMDTTSDTPACMG